MILPDIAAVVVHHRSYDSLPETVNRLLSEGVAPSKLVVIDNSEDPDNSERLKSSLPADVSLVFCSNAGYGAAVNHGVRWHAENTSRTDFLLVSTHESLPEVGAVQKLQLALQERKRAAVAGPALVTGIDSDIVWSLGGYFSPLLGLPRHRNHKTPRTELGASESRSVDWLDGAFLMFRRSVIEEHAIDESFFLYMEETDHQQLLQRRGWSVVIEPSAVVWQSSGGVPPYYQTRNIQLFQDKNGSRLQRALSAPYIIAHAIARDVVKRRGTSQWGPLIAGWKAGNSLKRDSPPSPLRKIVIVNPLGGALSHYTDALATLLIASGAQVQVRSIDEPSVSGQGRLRWLFSYLGVLFKARRFRQAGDQAQTLVTWPVVGFLDLLLVRALCGKSTAVVYHDPKPLVRAVGSGRAIARLVSAFPSLPRVVVHSAIAADAMQELGLASGLDILGHPMLPPLRREAERESAGKQRPVIRVLGQFKQDRDLAVLHTLVSELGVECDFEIVGRGWPAVEGWKVDARFVTELELDHLVRTSDVIVIPYKRFYQSGIAIRALEAGTPIVGRAATSLADLYGADSRLLVKEPPGTEGVAGPAWSAAVLHAIQHGEDEVYEAADKLFNSVIAEWRGWAAKSPASLQR